MPSITNRLAMVAVGFIAAASFGSAQRPAEVPIDGDDIGGVVTGARGPEVGVWVIAETDDLGTKYRKIVVTDDQGRYVLPDLPSANYTVWVRGYGLVDSPKVMTQRGRQLALTAVPAPNAKAAAEYLPANYWLSLVRVPAEDQFPRPFPQTAEAALGRGAAAGPAGGGGGRGQGPGTWQSQAQFISQIKGLAVRQLGTKVTREIPPQLIKLGFTSAADALRYGSTAGQMPDFSAPPQHLELMADWVNRIAAGEVPPVPPRPEGVERNLVVTLWDVSNQVPFIHDLVSTDKRNPTINRNGRVYGVEFHNDGLVILDPREHVERTVPIPAQIDKAKMRTFTRQTMDNPSIFWGDEIVMRDHSNPNHVTMDGQGRVWMSAAVNVTETPAFCRQGSSNRFAVADPMTESTRHVAMFDPRTERFTLIHTCFRTHHVQMATDGTNRLFSNPLGGAGGASFGWIDIDVLDKTRSHEAAQGWCRLYFDVDGDGHANRDRPVPGGPYSIIQNPVDGSLWGAVTSNPGHIVRLSLGANPPETCVGEMYEVPFDPFPSRTPGVQSGFIPRGIDVDSTGVIWTALAGSGHLASFDRRLCDTLTGEAATTGRHCAKGWKLYPFPGPKMQGVTAEINTDFHYYNFIDGHDALGLGRDTPLANGTNSDSLLALDKRTGRIITLRVPYPTGFYTRGMDGRIDNPNTGWKGKGLWAANGTRHIWHTETGKGSRGHMAQFQLRPDPAGEVTTFEGRCSRRVFCARACRTASGLAASALIVDAVGQVVSARARQAQTLPTIRGEAGQGIVTVRTAATPLAQAGGAARVTSNAGSFLVTRKSETSVLVVTALCSHEACLITQLEGDAYFCDCHGSQFDVEGRVLAGPAEVDLYRFEARLEAGVLSIML